MVQTAKILVRMSGILILFILLTMIDFNLAIKTLAQVNLSLLFGACVLVVPLYFFKALRWKTLLSIKGIRLSLSKSMMIYLASNFIAFITPGRLGELVKALYLKEYNHIKISSVLPTVFADRIFDVYFLLLVSLVGFLRLPLMGNKILQGLFLLFFGITLITVLMFFRGIYDRMIHLLIKFKKIRHYQARIEGFMNNFHQSLRDLLNVRLLLCAFLTLAAYSTLFIATFLLSQSAQIKIDIGNLIVFVAIANTLSFLPISVSGIGTRDAVLIFLFSLIGLPAEQAVVFSTLILLVFFVVGGFYGFICFVVKPISWKKLK